MKQKAVPAPEDNDPPAEDEGKQSDNSGPGPQDDDPPPKPLTPTGKVPGAL